MDQTRPRRPALLCRKLSNRLRSGSSAQIYLFNNQLFKERRQVCTNLLRFRGSLVPRAIL